MGPLHGVKVLEIAGIGPGPFAAMMLADMGADVLRLYRSDQPALLGGDETVTDTVGRGRAASVPVDLKHPDGIERVLRLAENADALVEGMRPGVMERLGLGPDVVHARNPRLVYGRMTGYGQDGPMAKVAGHDINYISIAGALGQIARTGERPLFPLNLLGDYGGGGMFLAFGVVCGLLEARSSGQGQVVDAAMVDGAALLTNIFYGLKAGGIWQEPPGTNVLDTGAHFYETYATADGGHIAVGAIEPQFYAQLLELLEIGADEMPQWDTARWPEFKDRLAELFKTRTRAEWAAILEPADACATAIYGFADAPSHPHNVARGTFITIGDVVQPGPAPRFSRTAAEVRHSDPRAALAAWGFSDDEIAAFD
ncbi:MAG TPA: CaiB/BaiF CoA-transferase family protein [Solirubrobacteraceae bacterium]|jgi:alpha-methylacyl-CoA racemase|nr:CaiB/BaiF CoA-transferase family protein [Solirubrobacteraceae bacterium]